MKPPDKITCLDDHREHVNIHTEDGNVHTIPMAFFEDVTAGRQPYSNLEDGEIILRAILREFFWLTDDR